MTPDAHLSALSIDAASALSVGARSSQEDAVVADFTRGNDFGFAVLADGMGGHASGEVASKIVVTEVFSELMLQRNDPAGFFGDMAGALRRAAEAANACLKAHVAVNPQAEGMGATLIVPVIDADRLHWISIGDSPLYLFRDGRLRQLNQDHSMAPEIDHLASVGELSAEEARNHPERNVLTSALFGQPIPRIDCPAEPFRLRPGDIVIAASDGLQFLANAEIEGLLRAHPFSRSDQLADLLIAAVEELADPEQDNVSMTVIRVLCDDPAARAARAFAPVAAAPEPSWALRQLVHTSRRFLSGPEGGTAGAARPNEG